MKCPYPVRFTACPEYIAPTVKTIAPDALSFIFTISLLFYDHCFQGIRIPSPFPPHFLSIPSLFLLHSFHPVSKRKYFVEIDESSDDSRRSRDSDETCIWRFRRISRFSLAINQGTRFKWRFRFEAKQVARLIKSHDHFRGNVIFAEVINPLALIGR